MFGRLEAGAYENSHRKNSPKAPSALFFGLPRQAEGENSDRERKSTRPLLGTRASSWFGPVWPESGLGELSAEKRESAQRHTEKRDRCATVGNRPIN